ncbi:MAG: SLC13 family permease, partial [Anaerolineaceae bacterium]
TTANIIMSDLLTTAEPVQLPLNMLDFLMTGGLIAVAGILFLTLAGRYLLPDREPATDPALRRLTTTELEDFYQIHERLWEARILPNSPVEGKTMEEIGFGMHWGITIASLRKHRENIDLPCDAERVLNTGDTLIVVGREEKVLQLQRLGLEVTRAQDENPIDQRGILYAEVILSPHSRAQRQTLKEINFRQHYGLTVVALRRRDAIHRTDVGDFKLAFGDSLLVIGPYRQFMELKKSPNYIVFEPNPSDQPLDRKLTVQSTALLGAAIAASILGLPVYLSVFFAALAAVIFRVVSLEEMYQSVEWQTVITIAAMYSISLAMVHTGLADTLGSAITSAVRPLGPFGVAASAFLLCAALTQVMGGQVTAMVTGPIIIASAITMHMNPQASAVAAAIGCSASFLTPIAHPVNALMIGPANYKFSDFARVGWPLMLLTFFLLLGGLSLFWGL